MLPEEVPVSCLFEDDHLLVVDKPPNVVVHPTFKHPSGTLMNALLGRARAWPSGQRPSLVGRLDKLTSGAVLVAKTPRAHALLQQTWRQPGTQKSYLAVVLGQPPRSEGEIHLRLRRDPSDHRRVVASETEGMRSVTRYAHLATGRVEGRVVSLLRCDLGTGRMHQIRVHLAAIDLPIVGDPVYGTAGDDPAVARDGAGPSGDGAGVADDRPGTDGANPPDTVSSFPRQALHSWRLSMAHPITGGRLSIEAPLPADMTGLFDACGLAVPIASLAERLGGAGGDEVDPFAVRAPGHVVARPEL